LDRFGRIVEDAWIDTQTDQAIDDLVYTYDRDSNVTSETNNLNAALDQYFTYNALNELTGYTQGNGASQSYGLDSLGNFDSVTTDGTTVNRSVNAQNQYTSVGGVSATYDNNGNLTYDPTA